MTAQNQIKVVKIVDVYKRQHYDYDVMAIYNHDLTKNGQHKTFLFCWHKQKPIVLVDESSKGNVVNLHVSQDKSLNGSFSNIMNGENI